MKFLAKWITPPTDPGEAAVAFVRWWCPAKPVKKATVYATALGVYAFVLNGKRIGKGILAPGWTSYQNRIQYQTYDVTPYLQPENRLEFGVGQGWAVGHMGGGDTRHVWADQVSFFAQMNVVYEDGTTEILATDEKWEVHPSAVTFTDIYNGETVDFNFRDKKLSNAVLSDFKTKLIPQVGEDITEHERIAPVALIHTPAGETVIDFGQNLAGYVEIRVCGKMGDRIVLHHAEVLDRDGNFYTANYRSAKNEVTYVLSGHDDICKPTFTFQGFRYIKLVEYPFETVDLDNFRAVVVHSDLTRTGHFVCGNEKINQLYHNIIWGQKSNYLDVPTDCPQRDERLGWTGDAQVFLRTAAINYDVERFFRKWLGDVAAEQRKDGFVEGICPFPFRGITRHTHASSGWSDVVCIAPWELYLAYGNKDVLRVNFPMMKKWVNYVRTCGPEEYLWLAGRHYGDWLAMDTEGMRGGTPHDFISSVYFYYSTSLLIKAGKVLGEDVSEFEELKANIRRAFRARFMKKGLPHLIPDLYEHGILQPEKATQTADVLVLHFGLCDEDERPALAKHLAGLIRKNGNRMTTGFLGTPYILHALTENGYTDLAYELLFQEKAPSWLFPVNHGATTMWEHWDSLKEDGTFWDIKMNSFNHYAYGAVFDWIFGVASGITVCEDGPGYRHVKIAPHPDRRMGFADNAIKTRNGKLRSYWYYKGNTVYYEFEIPAGIEADVTLPSGYTAKLTAGSYQFAE